MTTRFRDAPEFVELTDAETMFSKRPLNQNFKRGQTTPMDIPEMDFIGRSAPGSLDPMLTRRIGMYFDNNDTDFNPQFFEIGGFEITYSFPDTPRNNIVSRATKDIDNAVVATYGAANFSFRLLYEFLSETYNHGNYFIDQYFDYVFPERPVFERFIAAKQEILRNMADELKQKKFTTLQDARGRFASASSMSRYDIEKEYGRLYGRWGDFQVWKNEKHYYTLRDIGEEIRDDAINCLSTGLIPLAFHTSPSTLTLRAKLGLDPRQTFYATGQLINSMSVYINLDKEAA